jgi:hypothetical protein
MEVNACDFGHSFMQIIRLVGPERCEEGAEAAAATGENGLSLDLNDQ